MLRPRGNWRTPWRKPWGYPLQDWTPAQLFAGGWQGFYTDPVSGLYLFSDTAGTTHAPLAGTVARLDAPPGSPVAASFTNGTVSQQPIRRVDGLEFDGVDDRLSYPDDPALRFGTTDFTLAAAFRPGDLRTDNRFMSKSAAASTGTTGKWGMFGRSANLMAQYDFVGNTGGQDAVVATGVFAVGVWTECILGMDRSAALWRPTINGTDLATVARSSSGAGDISSTAPVDIGSIATAAYAFGRIGRALAINRLLTAAERWRLNNWLKAGHS